MAGRKTAARTQDWWDTLAGPADVQCEAHVQDGSRCRRPAIAGANVCRQHGGAIPAVRAKAAARIGNAADQMVKRLQAMLDDPAVEARDKIKIAQDLLDRAGLNATEKLIVGVGPADPVETLFRNLLADPANLGEPVRHEPSAEVEAYTRAALEAADDEDLLGEDVVEAEVVGEAAPDEPTETMSALPPKHIREDLKRLGLL